MLTQTLEKIKKSLTHSQFKLTMSMFKEDIKFHNTLNKKTEEELCKTLGQAANIAKRF